MQKRFKVAHDVAWQTVGGETMVIHLARGVAMGLNPVASLVWSLLEKVEEHGIVQAVVESFQVDEATAFQDVQSFLSECVSAELICPVENGESCR